ncbi:outer membrane protein assembly factor BamE [Variovorax sp. J22G21]|uniref:OmpA family protein n=1 Tax=Variovorax fucosicus TaxID=3053517 RepID=UPI002575CD2A|nr:MULTISPECIES: OmpA family protein [unclassified Variovorax]MDM0063801.1 outer membrane protein assembly factor BamE [Variovorax sp. J22G21]
MIQQRAKPLVPMLQFVPLAVVAAFLLTLGGCAGSAAVAPQAGMIKEDSPPPRAEDFPKRDAVKWKEGAFPSTEALRTMRTGMGKDEVRALLGSPHFSEGIAGVREWNYFFHFHTGKGPEFTTCQYMVRFNRDMLTNGMYWKEPDCAMLVDPPQVKPIPAVVTPSPAPAPAQKVTLGADGLFRFDGGSLADLQPAGRAKIEQLAAEIKRSFRKLNYVAVTGHTDRLGSESYNEKLSLARANTVADLLAQGGVPKGVIRTAGTGERQPLAQCPGAAKTPALVACLQPNRRVEIEVSGDR